MSSDTVLVTCVTYGIEYTLRSCPTCTHMVLSQVVICPLSCLLSHLTNSHLLNTDEMHTVKYIQLQ